MYELFRSFVPILVPLFVIATMLHVGLTETPARILASLGKWPFVLKMLVANFVLAPALMYAILRVTSFDPAIDAGLLVFSVCAGAPFLIKLTQMAEHDIALGAATMLLLMVVTVPYVPLVLPPLLAGMPVDAWAIAKTLFAQLVVPIVIGMLAARFAPTLAGRVRPAIAKVGNVTLYAVIVATLVGYWPSIRETIGTGAILAALVFVAGSFGLGYLAGWGADHLEDVGALGTAQRNTAAGLVIATQNFEDPSVLVIMTIANTVGLVLLLGVARLLSRDNHAHIVNV